jgi:hypothetical protein
VTGDNVPLDALAAPVTGATFDTGGGAFDALLLYREL